MSSIIAASPASRTRPAATAARRTGPVAWGRFALVGLGAVVAAVLANVAVYALGAVAVGYNSGFIVLANASGAILFTFVPAVGAALLYAPLLRFARRPATIFSVIAAIVFVVTLIPDFTYIPTVPGATPGQTAVLVVMHIVAAAVITAMLTRLARPRARA